MFSLISAMGSVTSASLATTDASTTTTTSSFGSMWILLIVFIAVIYLFMIRPEKKRNKETQNMLNSLKKGDKIVTIGGICGTVAIVRENSVVIKVDDNTRIEFQKNAISRVVNPKPETPAQPAAAASAEKPAGLFGKKKAKKAEAEQPATEQPAAAEQPKADEPKAEEPKAEN